MIPLFRSDLKSFGSGLCSVCTFSFNWECMRWLISIADLFCEMRTIYMLSDVSYSV